MGPIFVTGESRSGKTLVRWILSSHSRIAMTRRARLWPEFAGRFGDLSHPGNLDRCISAMLGTPRIAALGTDPDRLRRDFRRGAGTYARLFALVHEQHAERCGKARWGDQSRLFERHADELLAAYPDARVIHMVRDPRDRHADLLERDRRRGAAGRTTARWLASVARAQRGARRHPGRYCIIRYEALVGAAEATMHRVCDFLGEAFEPDMLRMDGVRRYDDDRAANGGNPISASYVGQYRRRLSSGELLFIQTAARRGMTGLGYRPDPNTLRLVARR